MIVGYGNHVCPSPEVLGAYIEGAADPVTRRNVQRHLSSCPECVFVVGETSLYLAVDEKDETVEIEEDASRFRDWWPTFTAATVAVVCLLIAWYSLSQRDPLNRLRKLAGTMPARLIESRLDGFPWRTYNAARSGDALKSSTLRVEAERVTRLARRDARTWHARGVAALLLGRPNDAIAMLQKSVQLDPGNAPYWSDLAAAHLTTGDETSGDHVDAAVAAARRAISVDPQLPSALFNEALGLERRGDRAGARRAWDRYLRRDPNSEWAREATVRRNLPAL